MIDNVESSILYRREFHKYAEPSWKEIRTTSRIVEILHELGYEDVKFGIDAIDIDSIIKEVKLDEEQRQTEIQRAIKQGANKDIAKKTLGYPGVVATLDTNKLGPTIAFRFDIDALPYSETLEEGYRPYDEEFASVNNNTVHACGHDGHTAIGLALAKKLINSKNDLVGKIKLIFQPAEESFCGAESIVKKGHLDDVDFLIAIHLAISADNTPLKSNTIACGCSDFLSDCQLDIYFKGVAAHPCGASQEGKNALLAACSAALNIHSIAPHEEGLLRVNVGEIHAGVCANTIAPNALMRVEYRGENNVISQYGRQRIMSIIEGTAKMYDIGYDIVDYGEVPTAKSDTELMDLVKDSAEQVPWFEEIFYYGNVGGTDDATVMMKKVQDNGGKAVYIGIGTDTTNPLHNDKFDYDESALVAGTDLLFNLIKNIKKHINYDTLS